MLARGTTMVGPMTVTLYSKPACQQCTATKRYFDNHGIDYTVLDVTEDEAAYNTVAALGYQQLPVVVAGDNHWSGFNPMKLATI